MPTTGNYYVGSGGKARTPRKRIRLSKELEDVISAISKRCRRSNP